METLKLSEKSPIDEEAQRLNDAAKSEFSHYQQPCESEQVASEVTIDQENKTKRVSFNAIETNLNNNHEVIANHDSNSNNNAVRNNSRINKVTYLKLHHHSFSPTGNNSTVNKLKGRYENIVKQTDNNDLKANIAHPVRVNTDKKPTSTVIVLQDNNPKSNVSIQKTTSNIEKLQNNLVTKLSDDTIEKLRNKYSPASFGYPKDPAILKETKTAPQVVSKIPVPTPRTIKSPQISEAKKQFFYPEDIQPDHSNPTREVASEIKDENSNVVEPSTTSPQDPPDLLPLHQTNPGYTGPEKNVEVLVTYDNIKFADPEDIHFIARGSSSEDSLDKVKGFLSEIVMEKKSKEKKRSNSFRKILAGGLFGRDKKKDLEDKPKNKKKDNAIFADNAQNESQAFDRNSTHRHTVDNSNPSRREIQRKHTSPLNPNVAAAGPLYYYSPQPRKPPEHSQHRYTEMKGAHFQQPYSPEDYVPMDNGNNTKLDDSQRCYMNVNKYIDTSSSSSNTLESESRNCTYQNALIAQAEMRQILENEKRSMRRASPAFQRSSNSPEMFRENNKNLQLVKPKALIPINSERPLPNPYHNNPNNAPVYLDSIKTLNRNLNVDAVTKPYPQKNNVYVRSVVDNSNNKNVMVEDLYGTVFDNISSTTANLKISTSPQQLAQRPESSSPSYKNLGSPKSVEPSKLKLPQNREKVELQPRIRSPIPQAKVSTDKIIATELLRVKKLPQPEDKQKFISSPNRPSSYQENRYNSQSPITPPNAQSTPETATHPIPEYLYVNSPMLKNKPPPSPRIDYVEAAEWQRHQRDLDKFPAMVQPEQITTNVVVHANPEEEIYIIRNNYPPRPQYHMQQSPRSLNSSLNNIRAQTPIQQSPPSPNSKSPEKQHILQNVEAFYWRELRKLKDKEEQDLLRYRQHQLYLYGYVEDPVTTSRRSRSVSPSVRRGPRSLSLPRDTHLGPNMNGRPMQSRGPEVIPEGRPVIAKQPITLPTESTYGQVNRQPLQRNPNFIRNTFERSTIGPMGGNNNSNVNIYENYYPGVETPRGYKQTYTPIFKRGSLTGNVVPDSQLQMSKKVSFIRNPNSPPSWPTKNGFTRSPPQRRLERDSLEDDVFLPNAGQQKSNPKGNYDHQQQLYQNRQMMYLPSKSQVDLERRFQEAGNNVHSDGRINAEQMYIAKLQDQRRYMEPAYSQRVHENQTKHFEPMHGWRVHEDPRRIREPLYGSRVQDDRGNLEPLYGSRLRETPRNNPEPLYVLKQVTVSNKVCDIYGQIHDSSKTAGISQNYGKIKQAGTVYGQLQQSPTTKSPGVVHQSFNQLHSPPSNFVRGTRLTASVNDMYKRYPVENPRYQGATVYSPEAPQRPLPPVPERKDSRAISIIRKMVPISDNESGSEGGEVQVILQSGTRPKNFTVIEEEWNSDGKSGRASGNESGGSRGENEGEIKSGRSRSARREDPRRHTLSGDQHYTMAGQGGPLSRTMDLEGQFPRGYPPSSNAMLFDDDPGIMSEVETSSTGFRRGGKQRSSLPVVRTPSKTLERPLGLVFLQYRNETKRALLPNEITSIDTVKALFVRSFPKQLSMEYLDSPLVKIYIHDSSKDMFYELEDVRSHLREIRDRSVLRLFESTDVSGGLPMGGVGIPGGVGHFEDPSYFSEPEFDSEYQHQHIHKSKGSAAKGAPYYMGSTTSLPRGGPLLRPYSPAVSSLPADRIKTLPAGAPPKPQRAYSSGTSRANDGSSRPPERFAPFQRPANPLFNLPDGYMSSPERGSRGYEDPYYSQYTSRSGSITPVIDEEVSDTELLDEQYSLYGVKLPSGGTRGARSQFPGPAAPPYDTTRLRVEHMERQLANLTGLVQKALTQTPPPRDFLAPPGRDVYRSGDEFDKNSSSSSASLPDDSYLRSDSNKAPKLGKTSCHKSVSFEKSVSFSDEPPDMNSPKQHSPQHAADTKPPKPAIKSSTLPRTSSQEKDRLKPAPPPKPASLSPGQYDGRHIYRDLQLTPEMYNQLRGLQKKAKDLRAEVRNLRRMSQAQAHSVRETIRDTFIKIRAMLIAGGEQVWQAGMDQERVRLSRDEDLYKQEMIRLEKDLTDLESSVEELRGNVINRKTRVNMSDVENMALVLSKSSKTVADLKLRFPGLQDSMKSFLTSEMDKVVREEKFLKEEPERLESALRRCKKLTGTLVTLKRLASVQEQRLPCSTSSTDGHISPSLTETPPVTPTSGQHSKSPSGSCVGQIDFGGDSSNASDSSQRPENALDALLDELQTFSKPHSATVNTQMPQTLYSDSTPSDPPAIPVKGIPPSHGIHFGYPPLSEIGRKGSMDSASILPTQNLTVSTTTGSLRRLHSYPSGSDTDNSPPIQPLRMQMDGKAFSKPPIPERNAELLQHLATGRRVPPPPPPRTSSKSPLASPTSPSLPPRSPATGLQHIQNVQNMSEKPQSQFEAATQNLGLGTLRRRSSIKDNNKAQTLPRNIGSNLQVHTQNVATPGNELQNVSSSSCESVNSQDGTKKGSRKEELEQRHQELLKKQKALQEQYARLQQLQRGNNTLAVVPPAPDQMLKKTGSESNLLQKMGLQMSTTQMTGSLTHLPSSNTTSNTPQTNNTITDTNTTENSTNTNSNTTTSKVYETDIL